MSQPQPLQTIVTPGGEELVVLLKSDFEDLIRRAAPKRSAKGVGPTASTDLAPGVSPAPISNSDRPAAVNAPGEGTGNTARGRLPPEVAQAIADGQNPIRVIRTWKGMTAGQLATKSGLPPGVVAGIEAGRRLEHGPRMRALAKALRVPLDILVSN